MPKISLKSVGAQIRSIQKQIRSSRSRAAGEERAELDDLLTKLDGLHEQAIAYCPKAMDGLPVKAAPRRKAAKAKATASKRTGSKRRKR
jgi:hypothetical protein